MGVVIYTQGLCYASVCAPAEMAADEVEAEVRRDHDSGTDGGWRRSIDETFKGGQPNPCQCDQDPGRKHWLFVC